jgi:hypothetical protein
VASVATIAGIRQAKPGPIQVITLSCLRVTVALAEVVGLLLIGVAVAQELVQVGGMGQERGLGLAVVAERGNGLVRD